MNSHAKGRRISGRAQQDHILDPYQTQKKPQEPTACPKCGAVYQKGRWHWGLKPADAHAELCPACRRVNDGLPAGVLTLHGDWARQHKEELIGLARNEEAAEKPEHPLNRIAKIEETEEGLVISTTDIHLPRRIGEAVKRAFHRQLDLHFDDAGYFLRADLR
jgi:NMD protein affecting ribosome stability and mRNA decay